jgi:hypothetical protein
VARAPRGGSWAAEYAARIARYERQNPKASRSAARGHAKPGERAADELLRRLAKLPKGSSVHFAGTDRQPDGTWRTARFDVLGGDGTESTYTIYGDEGLRRLPDIRDTLAALGVAMLGQSYLSAMADWVEETMPPPPVYVIQSKRSGRFLADVSPNGRAITSSSPGGGFRSPDRRRAMRQLTPTLVKRGYRLVAL